MIKKISIKDLAKAGRSPSFPIEVLFKDESVVVSQWLRILPGKRYVGSGEYLGKKALIKIFCGSGAAKKAEVEVKGIRFLESAGIETPSLVAMGMVESGGEAWVATEFIEQSKTLNQLIALDHETIDHGRICPPAVLTVTKRIAELHNQGLTQQDIHPDNFLFDEQNQRWFIIDTAEVIKAAASRLNVQTEDNIGLFLAQFPDRWQQPICSEYIARRDGAVDLTNMDNQAKKWKLWRAQQLGEKSLRDCTLFKVEKTSTLFRSGWRAEPGLDELLPAELDNKLLDSRLLKDGRTSTLSLVSFADRELVVKRYNIKNFGHWLTRFWRETRAVHSWVAAHKLRTLGLQTPMPLAVLEERIGPFRKRGFLLTEYCEGKDLRSYIEEVGDEGVELVVKSLVNLLSFFRRYKIAHGDFKATNFIWNGQLNLIDLDAVRFFSSESRWRKAYNKDLNRLLQNWPKESAMYQQLNKAIKDSEKE